MSIKDYPGLITGKSSALPGDWGKVRDEGASIGRKTVNQDEPIGRIRKQPIVITVLGTPLGKPRMTQRDKWKKRPCVMRYRAWADKVREAAVTSVPPAHRVKSLSWVATFEPPKSWSAKKRADAIGTLHRVKPDRDNIDKAVLDILYPKGDQAIARGSLCKQWGLLASLVITIETT